MDRPEKENCCPKCGAARSAIACVDDLYECGSATTSWALDNFIESERCLRNQLAASEAALKLANERLAASIERSEIKRILDGLNYVMTGMHTDDFSVESLFRKSEVYAALGTSEQE